MREVPCVRIAEAPGERPVTVKTRVDPVVEVTVTIPLETVGVVQVKLESKLVIETVKPSDVAVVEENTGVLGRINEDCPVNPRDVVVFKYRVPGVDANSFTELSVTVQVLVAIASHAVVRILKFETTE